MVQRRPTGDSVTASVAYKEWVLERLRELGWSRAELTRRLKYPTGKSVSSAAVSQFLGPEGSPLRESRTRLIPVINAALGGTPPGAPSIADPDLQFVADNWSSAPATTRAAIVMLLSRRTT